MPPRIARAAAVSRMSTEVQTASSTANAPASTTASMPREAAGVTDARVDSIPVRDSKEVAFYGAVVEAWIGTRMEFDKSLLTLSLAGIGVVITLLTAVGMPSKLVVGAFLVSTV